MIEESSFIDMVVSNEWKAIMVRFKNEQSSILKIGEKINQINEFAYMNGYNWAALIEYILNKESPNLLEGLESMPEGGSYYMRYELNDENIEKAETIIARIKKLIEEEEELYTLIKEEGDRIEWD